MLLSRKTLEKYLVFIIPLIAILIFINQFYRQHAYGLSVWKGGGMGMFAALDRPSRSRFVRIFITDDNGVRLPLGDESNGIRGLKYILATEPSEKNINTLLNKVKNTRWFYSETLLPLYSRENQQRSFIQRLPKISHVGQKRVNIQSIHIECGQLIYDIKTKILSTKVLKEKWHVI